MAKGYDGVRGAKCVLDRNQHWKEFCEYEQSSIDPLRSKMIVLCTYPLQATRTVDMLDVARAHQCSIVRRKGAWEFLETPN